MTTTMRSRTDGNGAATRARAAASGPPRTPVRRRWGRIGAGLAAAILGAWIFAALYLSAGDKVDVVVVANDVERMQVIERADLRVTQLSKSPDVNTVAGSRLDEFVGRVAGVDLVSGSLLNEAQVLEPGAQLVADGEAVVGVLVGPADAPQVSLRRGTPLLVVVRPLAGSEDGPTEVDGWVWGTSSQESTAGETAAEIIVPAESAALVSAAAADRRVSIVVMAE